MLCNKASSRSRLIRQNRFCAISCNCTKQFCAISCYRTKRVLCNKASLLYLHRQFDGDGGDDEDRGDDDEDDEVDDEDDGDDSVDDIKRAKV